MDAADAQAVGVDGWRGGWVAAAAIDARLTWSTHATFADVLDTYPTARVGVDIPIGLPRDGYRDCDLEARRFLATARSSVFLTPTRSKVAMWAPAAVHPIGQGISRQMWNILGKVVEVDEIMTPALRQRVAEVHPECSFRALTADRRGGAGPPTAFESKKTARGLGQRMTALSTWVELPALDSAPVGVPLDDLLDAAIACWTAQRWRYRPNELLRFGSPVLDEKNLPMMIIA